MKPILKAALLATAGIALVSQSATAATLGASTDLLIGFRNASDTSDVVVDLGAESIYANATSTIDLDSLVGASLASLFPVGGVSSIQWSVFGGQGSSTTPTLWLTGSQSYTGLNKASMNGTITGPIAGIENQYKGNFGFDTTISSSSESILKAGNTGSYTALSGTPNDFSTGDQSGHATGTSAVLYSYNPSTTGTAVGIGQFEVTANGDVEYFIAAVPEPATYGLLAGFGLLALALRRQITSKQA